MKFKRRVYELELKDTELTVYLHNPRINDFQAYLQKLQAFSKIGDLFTSLKESNGQTVIPDELRQDVIDLTCILADVKEDEQIRPITPEEVAQLSMMDCVNIVMAINSLTGANPTPGVSTPPETPAAPPA